VHDTERDFYMDGSEAKKYGLVDHVLEPGEKRAQNSKEKAEASS